MSCLSFLQAWVFLVCLQTESHITHASLELNEILEDELELLILLHYQPYPWLGLQACATLRSLCDAVDQTQDLGKLGKYSDLQALSNSLENNLFSTL